MTIDRQGLSEEELGKLLRLGDPASDGHEPSREEVADMRRAVLNAVDTPAAAHPWLSRSALAAAATVAVALIALAILLQAGPWGEVLQPETGPATPAEPAPVAVTEPSRVEPLPEPAPQIEVPGAVVAEAAVVVEDPAAMAATETPSDVVPPAVGREARTVRFTAPGGTRIIWTLDPDFQVPVTELGDRARGEM
jgi:hypothetical protein